jgi:hypothetical protein
MRAWPSPRVLSQRVGERHRRKYGGTSASHGLDVGYMKSIQMRICIISNQPFVLRKIFQLLFEKAGSRTLRFISHSWTDVFGILEDIGLNGSGI